MRLLSLLFLLPALSFSRRHRPDDYIKEIAAAGAQLKDVEEVEQPKGPTRRKYSHYTMQLFHWTTNMTAFNEMNDKNITIDMNTEDLGIVCQFDKTPVVVRLIPAAYADSCEFEGGIVAHCPDYNKIIFGYAEVHGPGEYVLTSFSDGTPEGKHATRGGFCKEGVKVPVTIVANRRDWGRFSKVERESILPASHHASDWNDDSSIDSSPHSHSSISVTISMAMLLFVLL